MNKMNKMNRMNDEKDEMPELLTLALDFYQKRTIKEILMKNGFTLARKDEYYEQIEYSKWSVLAINNYGERYKIIIELKEWEQGVPPFPWYALTIIPEPEKVS